MRWAPRGLAADPGPSLSSLPLQEVPPEAESILVPRPTALWGEVVGCIVWGSALLWVTIQSTVFPEVAVIATVDSAQDLAGEGCGRGRMGVQQLPLNKSEKSGFHVLCDLGPAPGPLWASVSSSVK